MMMVTVAGGPAEQAMIMMYSRRGSLSGLHGTGEEKMSKTQRRDENDDDDVTP